MALTLTYDAVLSRVRIAATGLSVLDTYTRSVSNSFGTADSGQAYTTSGGAASDYSVNGSRGVITLPTGDTAARSVILPDVYGDTDYRGTFRFGALATGNPLNAYARLRHVDIDNYYRLQVEAETDGSVDAMLTRVVAGSGTTLATVNDVATYSAASDVHWRVVVDGFDLRAKVWTGDPIADEPVAWTVEGTDATQAFPTGQVGVRAQMAAGNSNTNPTVSVDNLSAVPTVVVQRSTDQIRWTTVRGGTALTPVAGAVGLDDYEFAPDVANFYRVLSTVDDITPDLAGQVWLKSIARPFLNTKVKVRDWTPVTRQSRSGVFPIVGRSAPVAVTDLHGSRRWTLEVYTHTHADAEKLDLLISTGEVQFVHVPTTGPGRIPSTPGGYVALGDTSETLLLTVDLATRVFALPLMEVAAPGPDVIPAVGTWQTVVNTYVDWNGVIAAHADWSDLLQLVGSTADVIVP